MGDAGRPDDPPDPRVVLIPPGALLSCGAPCVLAAAGGTGHGCARSGRPSRTASQCRDALDVNMAVFDKVTRLLARGDLLQLNECVLGLNGIATQLELLNDTLIG